MNCLSCTYRNRVLHPNDGDDIDHFSTSFDELHFEVYNGDNNFYDGHYPGICCVYTITTHLQQQEIYPTFAFLMILHIVVSALFAS